MVERCQSLLFWRGWPARLANRIGLRSPLRTIEHRIRTRSGPPSAPLLTLAFASDFHAGVTTDPELLRRACDALRLARADVLLLGGDFVSLDGRQIDWLAPLIGGILAPFGRFAVLGNHDHWHGPDHITHTLERAGISVLRNRNHRLSAPFDHVWICGLDDFLTGQPNVVGAFAGADGLRIVLMHTPSNLLDLDQHRFDLALCGHTHGGQVALTGGRPIRPAMGPLAREFNRGRFDRPGGGTLIVSVGLGCSSLPIRINSDPEIVICRVGPTTPAHTGAEQSAD